MQDGGKGKEAREKSTRGRESHSTKRRGAMGREKEIGIIEGWAVKDGLQRSLRMLNEGYRWSTQMNLRWCLSQLSLNSTSPPYYQTHTHARTRVRARSP